MKGGNRKVVPKYIYPKNNPFIIKNKKDNLDNKISKNINNNLDDKNIINNPVNKYKQTDYTKPAPFTNIAKSKKKSYNAPSTVQPLMNLQLYQQGNNKKPNYKQKETVYCPINNAEYNPFGFNRQNIISPFTGLPMSMINPNKYKTIAKQYKIDMSGLGSREIDTIFETKLPNDNYKYESIKNRLSFNHFIRSNLVKRDGESVPLY